jgi:tetratricopeptide (TPR) repeat protein
VLFQLGEFARAQGDALEVVEAYDAAGELPESLTWPLDVRVAARAWLSYIPWFLGSPDVAVEWSGRARQLAERVGGGPYVVMIVELCSAACQRLRENLPATRKGVDAVLDLPSLRSLPEAALAVLYSGWLDSREGRAEQGIAAIRGYLAQQEAVGFHPWRTKAYCMLAEACLRSGRVDEGLAAARAGLAEAWETGEGYHLAELHRLKGELLLCQGGEGAQGEAESCFQTALEVARGQRALGWELRAATSLARLWQGRGEREPGRELLGAVYAAFTEGFTTGDLVAAEELLEELAPE